MKRLDKLKEVVRTIGNYDLIMPLSESTEEGLFNYIKYIQNTKLLPQYNYSDEYIKSKIEGYKVDEKRIKIEDILEEIKQKDIIYYTELKDKIWEFVK